MEKREKNRSFLWGIRSKLLLATLVCSFFGGGVRGMNRDEEFNRGLQQIEDSKIDKNRLMRCIGKMNLNEQEIRQIIEFISTERRNGEYLEALNILFDNELTLRNPKVIAFFADNLSAWIKHFKRCKGCPGEIHLFNLRDFLLNHQKVFGKQGFAEWLLNETMVLDQETSFINNSRPPASNHPLFLEALLEIEGSETRLFNLKNFLKEAAKQSRGDDWNHQTEQINHLTTHPADLRRILFPEESTGAADPHQNPFFAAYLQSMNNLSQQQAEDSQKAERESRQKVKELQLLVESLQVNLPPTSSIAAYQRNNHLQELTQLVQQLTENLEDQQKRTEELQATLKNGAQVGQQLATQLSCSTCLEEIALGDYTKESVITDCGHIFHRKCLFQWLRQNNICPECRKENPVPNFRSWTNQ